MNSFIDFLLFGFSALLLLSLCYQSMHSQEAFRKEYLNINQKTHQVIHCSHLIRAKKNLQLAYEHLSEAMPKKQWKLSEARHELTEALEARFSDIHCEKIEGLDGKMLFFRSMSTKKDALQTSWPSVNFYFTEQSSGANTR